VILNGDEVRWLASGVEELELVDELVAIDRTSVDGQPDCLIAVVEGHGLYVTLSDGEGALGDGRPDLRSV
jgi:hypothetical protein